ncbi:MAG: tetratricopeptide repeat protein [Bacteroidia bacterium]
MTNILIIILIIGILFLVYKIIGNKNKANKATIKSENYIPNDGNSLYNYLLAKLNRDVLQIEKHKEAIELEKQIKMSENNYQRLLELKNEVDLLNTLKANDLAETHFEKAEQYFKNKNTDYALMYYNKAIDLIKNPKYYNNRGCVLHSLDNIEDAISDYNQAILLNPNNGQYYYNRGGAYYAVKRNDEARRDWQKAFDMGIVEAEKLLQFYF